MPVFRSRHPQRRNITRPVTSYRDHKDDLRVDFNERCGYCDCWDRFKTTDKKHTGSYYTPDNLSDFIVSRISMLLPEGNSISILEPSVGDGSFLGALNRSDVFKQYKNIQITALDINKDELYKAERIIDDVNCSKMFECGDFLKYVENEKKKYDLIIGNPPYIRKQFLAKEQISICQEIHQEAKLSNHSIKNIWTAFLIKSTQLLNNNGILAFVLPSELLQVKFAEEIREYLQLQFQKLEIYTFSDLLFECKGQNTIVLLGFKQSTNKGVFYSNVDSNEQLNTHCILSKKDNLVKSSIKWAHHILDTDDLSFLHNLQQKLKPISFYCDSKPGIVTAANHYFIIDKDTEEKFQLESYTQPIIQRGFFVNGSVVFDMDDYCKLLSDGKPARLLCFKNEDAKKLSRQAMEYLKIGIDAEIPERYKCKKRDNWYVIPNISKPPEGFFFKRCHKYPKLLKNKANVLITDSAYAIKMNKGYEINQFIYSFYNSLTLVFSELQGRYYGGGVLELTPKEFKQLSIPITTITEKKFESFAKSFEMNSHFEDILIENDCSILNASLGLNIEEIEYIKKIRTKLILKRIK